MRHFERLRSNLAALAWSILLFVGLVSVGTSAQAASLINGGKVSGVISDYVEKDVWTFDAKAGTSVILQIVNSSTSRWQPLMALYDPAGNQVMVKYDYFVLRFDYTPPVTGKYRVEVNALPGYGVGSYDLRFINAPGANELGALVNGQGLRNRVEDFGDLDSYTFFAKAGEFVMLYLARDNSTFVPQLGVYDPKGVQIAGGIDCCEVRTYAAINVTGVHTVAVAHNANYVGDPGDFVIQYVRVPGANELGRLSSGSIKGGYADAADLDSWTFQAEANEHISLTLTDTSVDGAFAPEMHLFSPTGSILDESTDSSVVHFDVTAPKTGIYTVAVSSNLGYGGASGSYSLALNLSKPRLSYVALGDSFSSGESVVPFSDTLSLTEGCHRSTKAYPTMLHGTSSAVPFARSKDAQFDFFACSGAVAAEVSATGPGRSGEPPQLSSWNAVDGNRDLVTVSIGGNNAQFPDIVTFCLLHKNCIGLKPFKPYSNLTVGDLAPFLLSYMRAEVEAAHQRIRQAAYNATILAFGYPILLSGNECAAASVYPFKNLKISADEQAFLKDLNAQVNEIIRTSALAHNLHWVPVADLFAGHEVCSADPWINGVIYYPKVFSFHPTLEGQQAYAAAGNAYLQAIGFTGLPVDKTPDRKQTSMKAAKAPMPSLPTFGPLSATLPAAPPGCAAGVAIAVPGQPVRLQGMGFSAGETVALTLFINDQRTSLGTAVASAAGLLDVRVIVPASVQDNVPASIEALGGGASRAGRLLTAFIRISSSALADTDNDGIADACDTCTAAANPDQRDTNGDGYGNICDADLDNNGIVDDSDGEILQRSSGLFDDGLDADLNGDRSVDQKDNAIFKRSKGKQPGPSAREVLSGTKR